MLRIGPVEFKTTIGTSLRFLKQNSDKVAGRYPNLRTPEQPVNLSPGRRLLVYAVRPPDSVRIPFAATPKRTDLQGRLAGLHVFPVGCGAT